MITKLWFYPPLAFARLGPSATPCDNFQWGPNDLHPRGTGKTTIQPAETLSVAPDGTVTASVPTTILFKDAAGLRPVCPFFELHGEWTTGNGTERGPITPQVLALFGLTASNLRWQVQVANLKPHHFTLLPEDRIAATVEIAGDVTTRQPLLGVSPAIPQRQPLVLAQNPLPLGSIQLTRPTADLPEFRLRFTPAAGHVYGPTNLLQRSTEYPLPPARRILNPQAPWCRFDADVEGDARTNPGGLYATDANRISLGLVDDVCDGFVRCSVGNVPPAVARIVVGPPRYAPDRRPFTSLADGLTDRVRREDVHDPAYVDDLEMTTLEVRDFFERILETVELMNLDAQNDRVRGENAAIAEDLALAQGLPPENTEDKAFPRLDPVVGRRLPLTETGRQRHRRFVSLEVFEDILRERPDLIDRFIRPPMTAERFYDRRMPALMRGSDRDPMHITRRQYDLLVAWARRLRADAEGGT